MIKGYMILTGGTGKAVVDRGDWDTVEKEFKAVDLLNVLQCFELEPERREWVTKLWQKRMREEGQFNHRYEKHINCQANNCPICDGGLAVCTVCGGAEGSLPTDCPQQKMTWEQQEAVFQGELDYVDGFWVKK
jgi:hypothetical protein